MECVAVRLDFRGKRYTIVGLDGVLVLALAEFSMLSCIVPVCASKVWFCAVWLR